jgi:hypothetical protein
MATPRIALAPKPGDPAEIDWAVQAVREGGGEPVGADDPAEGLVWLPDGTIEQLAVALAGSSFPTPAWSGS